MEIYSPSWATIINVSHQRNRKSPTLMVVTTSVLFWRLSTISWRLSVKFRVKVIPYCSCHTPTWNNILTSAADPTDPDTCFPLRIMVSMHRIMVSMHRIMVSMHRIIVSLQLRIRITVSMKLRIRITVSMKLRIRIAVSMKLWIRIIVSSSGTGLFW